MTSTSISTFSFAAGVISPELASNIQLNKQGLGVLQGNNVYVTSSGTLSKKPGTKHINETKGGPCRLIPFVFNKKQSYALEFGDEYIRFYRDEARLIKTDANTDDWITANDYIIGDFIKEASVIYYCIEVHTSGVFATDLADGKWVEQVAYEIPTAYKEEDIGEIRFTQSADFLYLTNSNHPPRKLIRVTDIDWMLEDLIFIPNIPLIDNLALSKGTPPSPTAQTKWEYTVTIVDDKNSEGQPFPPEAIEADVFLKDQPITVVLTPPVDRTNIKKYNIYRKDGINFFLISSKTEDGSATYELVDTGLDEDVLTSPPELFDEFTGEGNYPAACGFHQQRLVFGGTDNKKNFFWMSRIGDFENFTRTPTKASDEGAEYQLNSEQVNKISHFRTMDDLIILTEGDLWRAKGTPNIDFSAFVESTIGSSDIEPIKTRKSLLFLENDENTVSDFMFSDKVNGYDGNTLSAFSRVLFDGFSLTDFTFSNSPSPRLLAIRDDGKLMCLTYLKSQNITAWTIWDTKGKYETMCTLPKSKNDEVYMVVNRDGKRYIETLQRDLLPNQDISEAWYIDCGARYDGSKTNELIITNGVAVSSENSFSSTSVNDNIIIGDNKYKIINYNSPTEVELESDITITTSSWVLTSDTIGGLDWLANKTVSVLADASAFKDEHTVDEFGNVNLGDTYSKITIGLTYDALTESVPINIISSNFGSSLSRTKKDIKAYIGVYRTRGVEWKSSMEGSDWSSLAEQDAQSLNSDVDLQSGKIPLELLSQNQLESTVFVRSSLPLPFNLLNVTIHTSFEGIG